MCVCLSQEGLVSRADVCCTDNLLRPILCLGCICVSDCADVAVSSLRHTVDFTKT